MSFSSESEASVVINDSIILRYSRKYPRLFSSFKITEYLTSSNNQNVADRETTSLHITLRDDLFISKFIEDCYNAAYAKYYSQH
jgi:hypothetical protein